jgi:hypothetical protein
MCDCDSPQAQSERWPTARQEHVCCECGGTIKPGEKYQLFSGVWEGTGMSFKTCAECHVAREYYRKHFLPRGYCAPCFGEFWSEATDHGNEGTREQWLARMKAELAAQATRAWIARKEADRPAGLPPS